jgi:hypothetical protein
MLRTQALVNQNHNQQVYRIHCFQFIQQLLLAVGCHQSVQRLSEPGRSLLLSITSLIRISRCRIAIQTIRFSFHTLTLENELFQTLQYHKLASQFNYNV